MKLFKYKLFYRGKWKVGGGLKFENGDLQFVSTFEATFGPNTTFLTAGKIFESLFYDNKLAATGTNWHKLARKQALFFK